MIKKIIRKLDKEKIVKKLEQTKNRKITCQKEKIKKENDIKKLEKMLVEEIDLFTENFNEKELRRYDIIYFSCDICGKDYSFEVIDLAKTRERFNNFKCKMCSIKETNIKKYGVEYTFERYWN